MIFLLILIFCVSCCVIHFTAMLLLRIFLALRCAFVIRVGFVKNLQAFFVEMYSYTSCKKCKFLLNCLLHKRTSIAEKKPNQLKQTLFLLKKEKKMLQKIIFNNKYCFSSIKNILDDEFEQTLFSFLLVFLYVEPLNKTVFKQLLIVNSKI